MSQPDYLICMNCESPCYVFDWRDGQVADPICEACGNDDPDEFASPEDYEALLDS